MHYVYIFVRHCFSLMQYCNCITRDCVRTLIEPCMSCSRVVHCGILRCILWTSELCGRPPQYTPAPCDLDLWPFDLESGIRVRCDVGYLCANFSLPRPLCSRLGPDVHDRLQTDRCQTASSLNAPSRWLAHNKMMMMMIKASASSRKQH